VKDAGPAREAAHLHDDAKGGGGDANAGKSMKHVSSQQASPSAVQPNCRTWAAAAIPTTRSCRDHKKATAQTRCPQGQPAPHIHAAGPRAGAGT
jgi:hypothetical protein